MQVQCTNRSKKGGEGRKIIENVVNSYFLNFSAPGKLLFAEDTMEEDAASKDSVAHPKLKKGNIQLHLLVY